VHEYPFRDEPYTEDLGRRARRIAFSAFVIGDDVAGRSLDLLSACQTFGPGLLVHPAYPARLYQCESVETEERWDKGRYVEFRLAFVEPGQALYPTDGADTQAATRGAADTASGQAAGDFAARTTNASTASGAGSDAAASDFASRQASAVALGPAAADEAARNAALARLVPAPPAATPSLP
jgi:hypothetical protein